MKPVWMIAGFVLAVILSLAITPQARRLGIMDKPDYRKIHDKPIPKGGGIGIFIPVILLELWAFLFIKAYASQDRFLHLTILFVTVGLTVTGLLDDKLNLNPKIKLCIQIVAAIATLSSGLSFHAFNIKALDMLLTALWIMGIINAVNLIDGLDGLAAGFTVIACTGFVFIGYAFQNQTITFLSLVIAGGCLGFLKYNFRPARTFMGDTGSIPLGYTLAILGILCENTVSGKASAIIPVIMLGIPIFDTLLTIIRRAIRRQPVFQPDRSHFYNLMIDRKGMEHKSTVLLIYAIQAALAALSCILTYTNDIYRAASICILIFAACLVSKRMGFMKT